MLRTPRGWATDIAVLLKLGEMSVEWVCLTDSETDRRYWAPVSAFWRRGIRLDRGHGAQLALVLRHWEPMRPETKIEQPRFVQLAFEGVER
jgi:hypothetical protein